MEERISRCLNEMIEFIGYDPDKKIFKLSESNLDYHYKIKNLIEYANNADPSGHTTLIYLSNMCRKILGYTMVNVLSVIENPQIIKKYVKIKQLLDSEIVVETKREMMEMIDKFASSFGNVALIGERNSDDSEQDFLNSIESVVEEFKKLKFEVYSKSNLPVGKIERFAPEIKVFGSLSQCVVALEKSSDGICICYISSGGLDGYFGFFVKSNGNIFSLNERLDEAYVGQHNRCRNGRYAEGKAFDLFPYDEICKFSGEDYKGYSTNIEIDQNCLNIFDVGKTNRSVYMRMIISMALIVNKYSGVKIDDECVFIDSLMQSNLKKLEQSQENALMKIEDASIVKRQSNFKINFDKNRLINGDYNYEFHHYNTMRKHGESGHFPGYNQELVKIYGQDFEFSNEELLSTDSSRRLIGDSEVSRELVGSKKRMELQAYYNLRKKLAEHIKKKISEDIDKFGGINYFFEWYRSELLKHKKEIYKLCLDCFNREESTKENILAFGDKNEYGISPEVKITADYRNIFYSLYNEQTIRRSMVLTPIEYDDRGMFAKFLCPITGQKANNFFIFRFGDWKQIEKFIGNGLPNFCKDWVNTAFCEGRYNGNPILDATDAVGFIESPFKKVNFHFSFVLGFSKNGLNKMNKELAKQE